jgi:hypothetical protein
MNLNEIENELIRTLERIDEYLKRPYRGDLMGELLNARATTLAALANIEMSKTDCGVIDESLISAFDDVNLFESDDSNGKIDPTKYLPKGKRL